MKSKVLIILLLLLCAAPVAAVTYPQEYYTLGSLVDKYFSNTAIKDESGYNLVFSANAGAFASLASARELRRQTILLEKQNELLAEQVKAQWVETCYRPLYAGTGSGNRTVWKSECANVGYPAG
jgi:hypothetical protein